MRVSRHTIRKRLNTIKKRESLRLLHMTRSRLTSRPIVMVKRKTHSTNSKFISLNIVLMFRWPKLRDSLMPWIVEPTLFGQRSLTQQRLAEKNVKRKIACIVTTELLCKPTAQSATTRFSWTRDSLVNLRFKRNWKTSAENVRCHQPTIHRCTHHTMTTSFPKNFRGDLKHGLNRMRNTKKIESNKLRQQRQRRKRKLPQLAELPIQPLNLPRLLPLHPRLPRR